jgi:hypothetical protein
MVSRGRTLAALRVSVLGAGSGPGIAATEDASAACGDWREQREISPAWIAEEPPGRLDHVPDMNRANKKFVRQGEAN